MRTANVPPPMALHELRLDDNIVDVAINSAISQVVVLSRTSINIYSYGASPKQFSPPELISKQPLPADCGTPSQLSQCGNDIVAVSTHQGDSNEDRLYAWSKDSSKWTSFETGMEHLSTISTSSDFNSLCIQVQTGLVLQASSEFGSLQLRGEVKLPTFCPWIEVVTVGDQVTCEQPSVLSYLTRPGNCFWPLNKWQSICKSPFVGVKLHVVHYDRRPSHLHNYTSSPQIYPLNVCRW